MSVSTFILRQTLEMLYISKRNKASSEPSKSLSFSRHDCIDASAARLPIILGRREHGPNFRRVVYVQEWTFLAQPWKIVEKA